MTVSYAITAWSQDQVRRMPQAHAVELNRLGVVKAIPAGDDLWRLEADSRIGVLVGDGWELRVVPHLDIPKLFFLLAYSANRDGWHDLTALFAEADDVIEALASGFALQAQRALEPGPLRGYVGIEDDLYAFRGRIRFADQFARHPGQALPLELTYDDFTTDILENQMLRTAAEILLRLPRIPELARRRLLYVRAVLEDVSLIHDRRGVVPPAPTRLNLRYGPALALAAMILRASSLSPERESIAVSSFLFDMNEVFESFLHAALRDALRPYGGDVVRWYVTYLEESGKALQLKPDITWWHGGKCRAIVDAKYKSIANRTMPNADAYQMLAYCIGLGVPRGHLVYARDSGEQPREHVVKRHGYVIDVRAVDVEKEPAEVLAQVEAIAASLAQPRFQKVA